MIRWSLALWLFVPLVAHSQTIDVVLEGKVDAENTPVRVPLQWPKDWKLPTTISFDFGPAKNTVGQLTEPSFTTEAIKPLDGKIRKDLVFIAPKLEAGKSVSIKVAAPTGNEASSSQSFAWKDTPGHHADLVFGDAPVMRYWYKTYDTSSPEARNKTYKVFHHLFDPSGSGRIVTNGGHTDDPKNPKDLLFPHHRGLMFGVNKCSYNGKKADTWHCTNDAHVSHVKTLHETAGPVLGEHRVLLTWHGPKNEIFAEEERQMSVYKVPGGTLVEFATRLTPKFDKLQLDGDPQHAGFQFRASNDVAKKSAKETYYLRPDGKGKPGATRNWPGDKTHVNLPWNVLSFTLDGKRYSVEYIDHPNNPGEKRYSERDYGRFGCYFVHEITPSSPLLLNHRVWLQEGEMTIDQANRLRDAFVNPPQTTAK